MSNKEIRFKLHLYLETHSRKIFNDIERRTIVYLDLNYWIRLRKGAAREDEKSTHLFRLVSHLHESRKCIFPISEIVFWELLKQEDIYSRTATIKIVDKFSEGITISNEEYRRKMEVCHWLNELTGKDSEPANRVIWSKVNTMMNYHFCQTIPDKQREPFLDFVATLSLEQVVAHNPAHFKFKDNIERLNTAIKAHAHENKTPQNMFLSEVGGVIAEHAVSINEAIEYVYFKQSGVVPEHNKFDQSGLTLDKLMYQSFKLGKITSQLPSIHIYVSLHSWMRWTKKDFKDGNDTMDFMHATVALPYAEYFLTERRLTAGIKEMLLDKIYNCTVYWQQDDVIACLESLNATDK